MKNQLIECVPNFSEGRELSVIKQITDRIVTVEAVKLLDVDPGKATNRTVVTFMGPPADVVEAAVRAVGKASEVIDMRKHKGEHPRFGATDVCPDTLGVLLFAPKPAIISHTLVPDLVP